MAYTVNPAPPAGASNGLGALPADILRRMGTTPWPDVRESLRLYSKRGSGELDAALADLVARGLVRQT